jgi:hypothetical protein
MLINLENSVALPVLPSKYDDMKPQREEICVICKKEGSLVSGGWYTETYVDTDEDGYYLAGEGDYLIDAFDSPAGWVCSNRCRSQAMYQLASELEKESLRKVRNACWILAEYGKYALDVVNKKMDGFVSDELIDSANNFLEVVADDCNNMPEWCEEADNAA